MMKKNTFIIFIGLALISIPLRCMFSIPTSKKIPIITQPSPITTCAVNACYINSVIQAFYAVSSLRSLILNNLNPFPSPIHIDKTINELETITTDTPEINEPKLIQQKKWQEVYRKPEGRLPYLFWETTNALANNNNQEVIKAFQAQAAILLNNLAGEGIEGQQDASEFIIPFIQAFREQIDMLANSLSIKNTLLEFFPDALNKVSAFYTEYPFLNNSRTEPHHAEIIFSMALDEDMLNKQTNNLELSKVTIKNILNSEVTTAEQIAEDTWDLKKVQTTRYFDRPPKLLIFSLKRFDFSAGTISKDTRSVAVEEILNLNFILNTDPNLPLNYKLRAAIHHTGGTGGGHYVTYANYNETWWYCSDSIITQKGHFNSIKKEIEESYIFIYEFFEAPEIPITAGEEGATPLTSDIKKEGTSLGAPPPLSAREDELPLPPARDDESQIAPPPLPPRNTDNITESLTELNLQLDLLYINLLQIIHG